VKQGRVLINGKPAVLGEKVEHGDSVTLDDSPIEALTLNQLIFIVLNKPVGIICTAAEEVQSNIIDFVGHDNRIYPIGRLDKDSQGLIFLTNTSALVDKILKAENHHEKEYRVTVNKKISQEFISGLGAGVPLLDTVSKPCHVNKESEYVFNIILEQGLNKQIRRMCGYFNYRVTKLERIRIMHISIGTLPIGEWRNLSNVELDILLRRLNMKPI